MPSGTRATSAPEALPATANETAAIARNHLIPRDYPRAGRASTRPAAWPATSAGNVTGQAASIRPRSLRAKEKDGALREHRRGPAALGRPAASVLRAVGTRRADPG